MKEQDGDTVSLSTAVSMEQLRPVCQQDSQGLFEKIVGRTKVTGQCLPTLSAVGALCHCTGKIL